ncbi:type I-E CRISPR-associated protein Cse1/CasA [Deinococcus sp.]|uniref:type I-E CRISPR-associated protein Cse1/CasA n=1 Tax=Deinococcus sp. TaxID=47478 RepID=UPI0025EE7001|nr:type I-E CRISPR-associated protein Cse1/CasA [Deinococcus sp.]
MNSPPIPPFNLLHEPWIPVRSLSGGPVQEVGLRELLLRAREFGRIDDASPLISVALLRLSLALLHRALQGPKNAEVAAAWFRDGFPTGVLEAYFEQWAPRFELFDPEQPFWQVKVDPTRGNRYHWSLLAPELNGSNTTVLFGSKKRLEPLFPKREVEMRLTGWLGTAPASYVARLLAQNQSFALGGRTTGASESQQGGPIMSKAMFVPQGRNLLETLCFNLVPYGSDLAKMDRAVWEWQSEGRERSIGANVPLGPADRYTWLSRGITLFPSSAESSDVGLIAYGAGLARAEDENRGLLFEPMAALISKKVEGVPTLLPYSLNLEKLAWRDLSAILPEPQNQIYTDPKGKTIKLKGHVPMVIQNASQVLETLYPQKAGEEVIPIIVFGQILGGKPGITSSTREETYNLPIRLVEDWDASGKYIDGALSSAKNTASALQQATTRLATEVLSRGGEREPHGKDVKALVRTLPGLGTYWASLEAPFRVFLASLEQPEVAEAQWRGAVTVQARHAWALNMQGAGQGGQVLGFAYRPRRTDGKYQPSPQTLLERAILALHRPSSPSTTAPEASSL